MSRGQQDTIAALRIELEKAQQHLRDTLWMAEKWAECEHTGHPARVACEEARAYIEKAKS